MNQPVFPEMWPFGDLEAGRYACILADPAWRFSTYSVKGEGKSPQAQYDCMPLKEIMALPVGQLAAPDCALVLWATAPMLPDAVLTMKRWGFTFKSAGAWAKQSSTGRKLAFGTGYCYRSAAEFFLLGTRGAPKQQVRNVRNLILSPVREHSRKPDQMHRDLEALWPGPRVELFARQSRPGWDSWGNQVTRFDEPRLDVEQA